MFTAAGDTTPSSGRYNGMIGPTMPNEMLMMNCTATMLHRVTRQRGGSQRGGSEWGESMGGESPCGKSLAGGGVAAFFAAGGVGVLIAGGVGVFIGASIRTCGRHVKMARPGA